MNAMTTTAEKPTLILAAAPLTAGGKAVAWEVSVKGLQFVSPRRGEGVIGLRSDGLPLVRTLGWSAEMEEGFLLLTPLPKRIGR